MTLATILIVDPDANARSHIACSLRELGHDVSETSDAISALAAVRMRKPDLMVCEYSLPDLPGVELLSDVRGSEELREMRVVMTSDRSTAEDVVAALKTGADDFVSKPIDMSEFLARVDACLRRQANQSESSEIKGGAICIDTVGHRVFVNGNIVSLAPREYRLMLFLLSNQDCVYSRKQLLFRVWDQYSSAGPRTVDVHIRRLRRLLEPFGCERYLQTVRGYGYRFSLKV